MAGPIPPPSWLFPSISSFSRLGDGVPPTWHVVFIYPMEDTERVAMMTKLSSVDKEWTGRPQTEMRRLVEIPWLIMDWSPPTSVIFTIWKEDPLIFIDGQSQIDHTAIIVWKSPGDSSPEAARVPIGRANMLLGIAASIGLSSDYPRILPERKEETANKTINGVLPPHLSGIRLEPSTPTLISLIHLPEVVQENLELMIGHPVIIHNWPENQEPCSRAQLFRMFQALKIGHEGNDQTFALFIDDDVEGYHIVRATGTSGTSKLELTTLLFEKVADFWNAAWNPESHIPHRMPRGQYSEFANHRPPTVFLAVDRKTLSDALEPIDEREDWEAIIVASYEGGDVWFEDDMHRSFAHISTGYGYYRGDFEEVEMIYTNLKIANMSYEEMCHGGETVYWSAYRAWAETHMGEEFARSFSPEGMKLAQYEYHYDVNFHFGMFDSNPPSDCQTV